MKGFKEVDEKAGANNDKIQQSAKEIPEDRCQGRQEGILL